MRPIDDLGSDARANEIVQKLGFKNGEVFKEEHSCRPSSRFQIKYYTDTKELIIVNKGSNIVVEETGLKIPPGF